MKKSLNKNLSLGIALFLFGFALIVWVTPQKSLQAFSPTGCEGDCAKCHTINNQDVKGILQDLKITQAEVLGIQMSPIKGLWEITINDRGKRGVLYVDFSKSYILPGPIIEVKTGANKTMEKLGKDPGETEGRFCQDPPAQPLNPGESPRLAAGRHLHRSRLPLLREASCGIGKGRPGAERHRLSYSSFSPNHAQGCLLEIQEHRLQPFFEDARGGLCPKADPPVGVRHERH